jgi:photosynthetic reaction center H subunit
MPVFGADRQVAGTVVDLWVDRGESFVRYYEVELGAGGRRVLMPATFCTTGRFSRTVKTEALLAAQFADIPGTKDPDSVTLREEERIMAYFGAGTLYASPARQEPIL